MVQYSTSSLYCNKLNIPSRTNKNSATNEHKPQLNQNLLNTPANQRIEAIGSLATHSEHIQMRSFERQWEVIFLHRKKLLQKLDEKHFVVKENVPEAKERVFPVS